MSVLSHLQTRARAAVLSGAEKASIDKSISAINTKLKTYFDANLVSQFRFGSSTRDTILPRSMDMASDIDYMVVLKEDGKVPQTYLDRMKRFAEKYYSTSDIKQSTPSIVLELNHIKFDLVPAFESWAGWYKIPARAGGWQDTNPNDFNASLTEKNKNNSNLIKPTIRLAKYWNAINGYVFDSFIFEKWIIELSYWNCTNQKDYLFTVFDNLQSGYDWTQFQRDKVARAKQVVKNVRDYEQLVMLPTAEIEIKKLIP